jgi:hypothetical protein
MAVRWLMDCHSRGEYPASPEKSSSASLELSSSIPKVAIQQLFVKTNIFLKQNKFRALAKYKAAIT